MKDGTPLLGAIALDPAKRASLCNAPHLVGMAARAGIASAPGDWWVDDVNGIVMLAPEAAVGSADARAALGIRGTVRARGREDPPAGWLLDATSRGATSLLYDLLARDTAAVGEFRGDFALAVWDGARRRLLLARDHLGQRGLFTATDGGVLWFASDPAVLPFVRAQSVELDMEAAFWYLAFGLPPPGGTLARGIRSVPSAHVATWSPGELVTVARYWSPLVPDAPRDATPEVVEAIRAALDAALAPHGGSSTGVLLSGGVDSSYAAAGLVATTGSRPRAYTVEFEPECGMNETEFAVAVADWLALDHTVVRVEAPLAAAVLTDWVLPAWQPCGAWATISQNCLLEAAQRDGVTALVSGLGADEVFGGYDHFRGAYSRYLRYTRRQGLAPDDAAFADAVLPGGRDTANVLYAGVARFFDNKSLREALEPPYARWEYDSHLRAFYRECVAAKPDANVMELMVAHECQHRVPDLLLAGFEPVARRVSVQTVYPFLDPDVVRLAAGLGVTSRYRTLGGQFSLRLRDLEPRFKHAMLEVARGRLPDAIVRRTRKSLTAPFGAWMFSPAFRRAVVDRLAASSFWDLGLVRRAWLDAVLERLVPGPSPHVFQLWALVTLAAWCDTHIGSGGRL